jgi:hypothetical protein
MLQDGAMEVCLIAESSGCVCIVTTAVVTIFSFFRNVHV